MDDIMILFHTMVIDLQSFDETQFGVFNEHEQPELVKIFGECDRDIVKFLRKLSPCQKQQVAAWACSRSSFDVKTLHESLKKFLKYLETVQYTVYPKTAPQPEKEKKKKKKF